MKNKFFSKKILIFIVLLFLLITFFFSHLINKTSNDPYKEFRNIDPNTSLVQLQDEYYVYFYKPSCKYCKEITIYILLIQKNIIYKNMIGKILIQKTISKLEQVKTEKQLIFTVVNLKKNI